MNPLLKKFVPPPLAQSLRRVPILRWAADRLHLTTGGSAAVSDEEYRRRLGAHLAARGKLYPAPEPGVGFSVLTTVYEGTNADFFRETARSLLQQTYTDFEWRLLAHGPISAGLEAALVELLPDARVRMFRESENLGIMGGMRRCLETAEKDYVVPLDADDLITTDALQILAHRIAHHRAPAFLYSDEDRLVNGRPATPFFRPGWDPVLNLAGSYVWHLCAFQRKEALSLGVYSDAGGDWCHDWDTVFRFANAGHTPLLVPEVLYHWRSHRASATHQPRPDAGSLASQRHVLETQVARQRRPELYRVEPFPLFRGAPEWWIRRRREQPVPLTVILLAGDSARTAATLAKILGQTEGIPRTVRVCGLAHERGLLNGRGAFEPDTVTLVAEGGLAGLGAAATPGAGAGLTLVCHHSVTPRNDEWLWEAMMLMEFHPDLALISGRLVDKRGQVLAGGEVFGPDSALTSPFAGLHETDPGYYAQALKARTCAGVNPLFFLADTRFLREALARLPEVATLAGLGAWLGAMAAETERRVAFSPLISGLCAEPGRVAEPINAAEQRAFRERYGKLVSAQNLIPARRPWADCKTLRARVS